MKSDSTNDNIAGECPVSQDPAGSQEAVLASSHLHSSSAFSLESTMRDDNYTWVKLRRSIIGWEWFKNHKMYKLFTYLFMMAQHTPKRYLGYDIKRGQCLTGRKRISTDTGLSEAETKHFLNKLKLSGEIQTTTNQHFTVVTICKYELYQGDGLDNSQPNSQQTANQQPTNTTCKNDKNANNDKKVKRASPVGSLSFDGKAINGITNEDLSTWKTTYPGVSIEAEILKAQLWVSNNPTRQKKNYRSFLCNWFGRVQPVIVSTTPKVRYD